MNTKGNTNMVLVTYLSSGLAVLRRRLFWVGVITAALVIAFVATVVVTVVVRVAVVAVLAIVTVTVIIVIVASVEVLVVILIPRIGTVAPVLFRPGVLIKLFTGLHVGLQVSGALPIGRPATDGERGGLVGEGESEKKEGV
jgi:hypothetical protein